MKISHILVWLIVALFAAGGAAIAAEPCADDDVDCWLKTLQAGNDAMAMRAAMRLGELQTVKAIAPLIAKFSSQDQYMATAATHAVIKIGNPAVLDLVTASANSKSAAVRKYAAYALGRIGGEDAFAAVAGAAKDEDIGVRTQAATAFGIMKDQRSLLPLFNLLRDRSAGVRTAAALALGQLGDKRATNHLLEYGLTDLSSEVARAATQALVAIGPDAVEPLIDKYNSKPEFVRRRIVLTVGNIGARGDAKVRARAQKLSTSVLGRKNGSVDTRAVAAYTLGALESKEAIPALKKVLAEAKKSEEKKSLFAACEQALGKIYRKHGLKNDF